MADAFNSPRDAARAILSAAWNGETPISVKAAQFAGQVSVGHEPLSEKQADWLDKLLTRADLPPLNGGQS